MLPALRTCWVFSLLVFLSSWCPSPSPQAKPTGPSARLEACPSIPFQACWTQIRPCAPRMFCWSSSSDAQREMAPPLGSWGVHTRLPPAPHLSSGGTEAQGRPGLRGENEDWRASLLCCPCACLLMGGPPVLLGETRARPGGPVDLPRWPHNQPVSPTPTSSQHPTLI